MNPFDQMAADAEEGTVLEVAAGEFARVSRIKNGTRGIQLKTKGGKWQMSRQSADDEQNASVWADYRAMAAQHAARAAETVAAPQPSTAAASAPEAQSQIVHLALAELQPHPDAEHYWGDGDAANADREAICASVAECGVRSPLTVCPRDGAGWWVVDGCTRLEGTRRAGLATVPCHVTRLSAEEVGDAIYIANLVRHKVATGARVMAYLERHRLNVLAAARANADPAATGALGGRGNKGGVSDTAFSGKAIAARVGVSKMDVLAGIELLRCHTEGLKPVVNGRYGRELVEAGEAEREAVAQVYSRVAQGVTPIRRWAAAAAGRSATADKGKAPTNHGALALRALVSLNTALGGYAAGKMTANEEANLYLAMGDVAAAMPEAFAARFALSIIVAGVMREQALREVAKAAADGLHALAGGKKSRRA